MVVSKNRGTPKLMIYNGNPYSNWWFGGTTIFGNTHYMYPEPLNRAHVLHVQATLMSCWIAETCARGVLLTLQEFHFGVNIWEMTMKLHPGRLRWNLPITNLGRNMISPNRAWLCSMLIFRGVPGDSKWPFLSPIIGGHQQPLKGSQKTVPKRGTKELTV